MSYQSAPKIKRNMLEWVKHHFYNRASDEWGYDALQADPLVHLLLGACASEAKLVYDAIEDSDNRLLQRLLQYLLPNAFHAPSPAIAVAKAQPKTLIAALSDSQELTVDTEGPNDLAFTPVFDTTLVNGKVRFVGVDDLAFEVETTPQYFVKNEQRRVTRLLIGIETAQRLTHLERLAVYFDWRGTEAERRIFLQAIAQCQWSWNDQTLRCENGFLSQNQRIHDQFDLEYSLRERVNAAYQRHFAHISTHDEVPKVDVNVAEVLKTWLNRNQLDAGDASTAKWTAVEGHFVWLRLSLPYSIELTDVERNLVVALNHFPVVNRKLAEKNDFDTYLDSTLDLEMFAIEPSKGHFWGIRSVTNEDNIVNEKNNEKELIPPAELADLLTQKRRTAYHIRRGGIGRADSYNAWERLSYMLSMFREEYRHRELTDKLGDKLSLEELHEAIGNRISNADASAAATKSHAPPLYIFIQKGAAKLPMTVKVSYWQTAGESANNLPIGTKLSPEKPIVGIDPLSIQLVLPSFGGKTTHSVVEQTQLLQDVLLRRGRVVSAHDVKSLCQQKFGANLQKVSLRPFFEINRHSEGGVRRAIEVIVEVKTPDDPLMQQLGHDVEWNLEEYSVGTTPYRVKIC